MALSLNSSSMQTGLRLLNTFPYLHPLLTLQRPSSHHTLELHLTIEQEITSPNPQLPESVPLAGATQGVFMEGISAAPTYITSCPDCESASAGLPACCLFHSSGGVSHRHPNLLGEWCSNYPECSPSPTRPLSSTHPSCCEPTPFILSETHPTLPSPFSSLLCLQV